MRTLPDVFSLDGMNVNQELVKHGWCWWYRKYAPGDTVLEGLVEALESTIQSTRLSTTALKNTSVATFTRTGLGTSGAC